MLDLGEYGMDELARYPATDVITAVPMGDVAVTTRVAVFPIATTVAAPPMIVRAAPAATPSGAG
jgi:hypothetical protein